MAEHGDVTPISLLVDAARKDSFETYRAEMEQSMLFTSKRRNRVYAIQQAIARDPGDGLYVEFGVAAGHGCRLFGKFLAPHGRHMHGFDSFVGLEEDWTGYHTGRAAGRFHNAEDCPQCPTTSPS